MSKTKLAGLMAACIGMAGGITATLVATAAAAQPDTSACVQAIHAADATMYHLDKTVTALAQDDGHALVKHTTALQDTVPAYKAAKAACLEAAQ